MFSLNLSFASLVDFWILSCSGFDRLRLSKGFRSRRFEPLGADLETTGSTGSLWVLHALFWQTKYSFFRATLCDNTTCIPVFKAMFFTSSCCCGCCFCFFVVVLLYLLQCSTNEHTKFNISSRDTFNTKNDKIFLKNAQKGKQEQDT